jgi:hypothetical protein
VTFAPGVKGGALRFDGDDDYVKVPKKDALHLTGDVTVALWLKPATLRNRRDRVAVILGKREDWHYGTPYELSQKRDGTYWFSYAKKGGGWTGHGVARAKANEWQHIAVTRTADGEFVSYRDGKRTQSGKLPLAGEPKPDHMRALLIGATLDDLDKPQDFYRSDYEGDIDEVVIYNRVLPPEEIAALADRSAPRAARAGATGSVVFDNFPWDRNLLKTGDTDKLPYFRKRVRRYDSVETEGEWWDGWSVNTWSKEGATAEIELVEDPVDGRNAVRLTNLDGKPSIQIYPWRNPKLKPGDYVVVLQYLCVGGAKASVRISLKGTETFGRQVKVPDVDGSWQTIAETFTVHNAGAEFGINIQNKGKGTGQPLYVRKIGLARAP